MNDIISENLLHILDENGYQHPKIIEGRGVCALMPFIYTWGVCYGLSESSYDGRYCYHTLQDAAAAFKDWDGKEHPSGNWIKLKTKYGDHTNPNYIDQG